ncbi:hypothetical protein V2J09_002754 [Rumex salicifolius]
MEFWGVELKGEKPVTVVPGLNQVVHISQATLAELKKKSDPVMLYAKVGEQKLAIGVLKADNVPQLAFDLVFEKEFELSHNWKDGSVHLTGYKSLIPEYPLHRYSDYSDDEEPFTLSDKPNGVVAAPAASKAKPAALAAKDDKKSTEESDDESDEDDEDDSDADDESDEGDESDEEMDDVDSSDEEEETPVKSAGNKKRPASALKTPETKKAKSATPQKTDDKKSVSHVATPHPAKNAKTPKSAASQTSCGSCKKTFNSQGALDSHTKAKHSAAK